MHAGLQEHGRGGALVPDGAAPGPRLARWSPEGGRDRLADDPRTGRPPKLGPAGLTPLDEALERGPRAYGRPVTAWSTRDLCEFLWQRRRVRVSVSTVHRAVHGLGYRYRRPRHDLRHRQGRAAVASAKGVLAWLGKGPAPGTSAWSTSTSARPTGIPGRRRPGAAAAPR